MEAKLKRDIKKWLREQGAYVVTLQAGPGVPLGCPDIGFFYQEKWGVIEGKAAVDSAFRPGQQYTLGIMKRWNPFVYVANPDNWPLIQQELLVAFF